MERGPPERSSSYRPGIRWATKRRRHSPTVSRDTSNSSAIAILLDPSRPSGRSLPASRAHAASNENASWTSAAHAPTGTTPVLVSVDLGASAPSFPDEAAYDPAIN